MVRLLADVVVVVHLGFILFVALGALLAWRRPGLLWPHLAALAWAGASVTVGVACPLTVLEKWLRRRGGGEAYSQGFVDRYVEDVVYPEEHGTLLRAAGAALVVVGYALLTRRLVALRGAGVR